MTEVEDLRSDRDSGDRSASRTDAAVLWDRFHTRLVILGMRRFGSRADAEDIAQEVLQRVAQALQENRLREPDALPGFVFQTAKHVCLQWLRKRGREQRALEGFGQDSGEATSAAQPLTDLIDEERRSVVRRALQALAADDRHLIEQLYAHDTDPRELAEQLRITPGALRVRKHRALKLLSASLGEDVTD